jgi:hypothetical protein
MNRLYSVAGENRADIGQMLATPEHLSIQDEGRNAEHPICLRRPADLRDLRQSAGEEGGEARAVGTGLGQHDCERIDILDVQLSLPKLFKNRIMIVMK